ncbi:MAG: formylglycine-generating enzyme family protein [Planctomycetota bacterium]|nr:formylglycine-generating enzyme family protein [Planctomycetota bacterium]
MSSRRRRKLALLVSLAGIALLSFAASWYGSDLARWYEFVCLFERLGSKPQGFSEYRHRQTGIVMVRIPGGSFAMGSPESEEESWSNERPRHRPQLKPFLLAKYELSQAEWLRLMGTNPSAFKADKRPVENLSWYDCQDFNERTGLSFPSEAQWERACRGGTDTPFAFGETITPEQVNYNGAFPYGDAPKGADRRRTVAADSFRPNDSGLFNMHGNVSEWCEDVYDEDFYRRSSSMPHDPVCTTGSGNRVVRGGSWSDRARYCRSAARSWNDPGYRGKDLGYRPAFHLP